MSYYNPPYYPAYNPYFPMQMSQMNMPMQPVQQMQNAQAQTQPTIQKSNDFVSVRSKEEVINYPVALGNCVTFKHETEPYIYTKTMGFSQFDKPVIETIRLVKEDEDGNNEQTDTTEVKEESKPVIDMSVFDNKFENINESIQVLDDEMKETKTDIDWLKNRVDELSKRRNKATTVVKKVGESDE